MYLWAFDASLSKTGLTIFNIKTKEPVHVESFPTNSAHEIGKRLFHIGKRLVELKDLFKPSELVLEDIFIEFSYTKRKTPNAPLALAKVHGMILYLFHDVSHTYYAPMTIKATIVHGSASKKIVRARIEEEYPNIKFKNEDESDSFAIALTHLIKTKRLKWDKRLPKVLPKDTTSKSKNTGKNSSVISSSDYKSNGYKSTTGYKPVRSSTSKATAQSKPAQYKKKT